jgi:MYXO-CTERM domain-containing protein
MTRIPLTLLTAFTLLFSSACEELPAGDITSPQYWGDYFLAKYAHERQDAMDNLEPGPEVLAEPRTVLLVTGVTIPAEWFDSIVLRLERDGFNTVVYEPPELLSGDLFQASQDLAQVVEQVRAESGQDKIDILAECTGGLIARHYVQSLGGDANVKRLVTFVSPQNGLPKAALASNFVNWPAVRDLTPGSDFLNAVHSVPLPASVDMTSIYSCTDEYIQPYQTSIVEGATNIGLCDGFVGHFQTMYDPQIYLIMHDALIKGLDSEIGISPPGSADDPSDPQDSGDEPLEEEEDGAVGCSTSGGSNSSPLLLLGLALFLARRRRAGQR